MVPTRIKDWQGQSISSLMNTVHLSLLEHVLLNVLKKALCTDLWTGYIYKCVKFSKNLYFIEIVPRFRLLSKHFVTYPTGHALTLQLNHTVLYCTVHRTRCTVHMYRVQ